ncbi:MAG: hypothetical protein P8M32_05715 [Phycisphaerales bacterium]|nr:hypothetical protein [Phycisphaerales bacterium]
MNRTRQEIEALADIFVGDMPTAQPAPSDRVVLLVEGHLPVRGALWRHAAAKMVAGVSGGTLLDIEDRELQVVRFGDEPLKADTLEHVVGSPLAGHLWMVAGFGAALGPDVSEQVHEIVLLTGADQAAVVGAYRAIKQIVANHAGAPLSVGIIIAGSSPSVSEDVWTRLSGTFREHLGIEATLVGVLSQLDVDTPATRVTVAMPSEGLPLLLTTLRARPTGLNPSDHASLAVPPLGEVRVTSQPPNQPQPSMPEPPARRDGNVPDGLRLFAIDVPVPAGVQVAIDQRGAVHLVASESACSDLEAARQWAERHMALLVAADPSICASQAIVCDLLVDEYHRAASLADGHWTVYLVHDGGYLQVPRTGDSPHQAP